MLLLPFWWIKIIIMHALWVALWLCPTIVSHVEWAASLRVCSYKPALRTSWKVIKTSCKRVKRWMMSSQAAVIMISLTDAQACCCCICQPAQLLQPPPPSVPHLRGFYPTQRTQHNERNATNAADATTVFIMAFWPAFVVYLSCVSYVYTGNTFVGLASLRIRCVRCVGWRSCFTIFAELWQTFYTFRPFFFIIQRQLCRIMSWKWSKFAVTKLTYAQIA